jgi:hypothetical protein
VISTTRLAADKRILLRIPKDLHARLKASAAERGVSLNQLCVELLGGVAAAPKRRGPDDAERRQARGALAADHVARAEARLLALDVLFGVESWADVVRESHEVVDLAIRALLLWGGAPVRPGREAALALGAARRTLPPAVLDDLPALASAAQRLRRDRDLAFLGADDLTPWEFYTRPDADAARAAARHTVATVRRHVLNAEGVA